MSEFLQDLSQPFSYEADPKTAASNEAIKDLLASFPRVTSRPASESRAERETGKGPFGPPRINDAGVNDTFDGVGVRIFKTENPCALMLHIHGGGWTLSRPYHYDDVTSAISKECNMVVVSVDYRLAPEDPYPAAPDDCEKVAVWLQEHANEHFFGGKNVPFFIGGDSAGAHLTAVTLLRLKKRGNLRVAGAVFLYGAYDLHNMSPSARLWDKGCYVLDTGYIQWFTDNFVPDKSMRESTDVSPMRGDLTKLCPGIFICGTMDPLLDDTMFMHSRWLAGGNRGDILVYRGCIHGFDRFGSPAALDCKQRIYEWIKKRVAEEETRESK